MRLVNTPTSRILWKPFPQNNAVTIILKKVQKSWTVIKLNSTSPSNNLPNTGMNNLLHAPGRTLTVHSRYGTNLLQSPQVGKRLFVLPAFTLKQQISGC